MSDQGELFVHSMPGRFEDLALSLEEISELKINQIISLAPLEEIQARSPHYADLIDREHPSWEFNCFPIPDYSIPDDRENFFSFTNQVSDRYIKGDRFLVHCGAGIGRTGLFVTALLIQLGLSLDQALKITKRSGSYPETELQSNFLIWFSERRKGGSQS